MLDDFIATVKTHITHYDDRAKTFAPDSPTANPKAFESSARWAEIFREMLAYFKEQERLAAPIPKSLGDLSDLPDELVKELSAKRVDDLEEQILVVIRACGGEANLDQVLVGLYRKYKVVQTRRYTQNKLYRMSQKELIYPLPGQRAAYSLEPQAEEKKPPSTFDQDLDDEIPF